MADRTIACRDCGKDFLFTEGEQEFYQKQNFSDPVRCTNCRRLKKQRREGQDRY